MDGASLNPRAGHHTPSCGPPLIPKRCPRPPPPGPQATEALRITSQELVKFGVMDDVVPEPLGGAHSDPPAAFPLIKETILKTYAE